MRRDSCGDHAVLPPFKLRQTDRTRPSRQRLHILFSIFACIAIFIFICATTDHGTRMADFLSGNFFMIGLDLICQGLIDACLSNLRWRRFAERTAFLQSSGHMPQEGYTFVRRPRLPDDLRNRKLRRYRDQHVLLSLYGTLVHYLGRVSQGSINHEQTQELMTLINVISCLEDIGDIIETNLVHLGELRLDKGIEVSDETEKSISEYHKMVVKAVDMAVRAVTEEEGTKEWIAGVRNMQAEIDQMVVDASVYHMQRLAADAPNRVEAFKVEMDIRDMIRRIYYLARAIFSRVMG
ncbi:MAG: hypothetical protein H7839_09515 [Magnetococcus sp. YQC-5]